MAQNGTRTEKWTMVQAINHTLGLAMSRDSRILILGEDVGKKWRCFSSDRRPTR